MGSGRRTTDTEDVALAWLRHLWTGRDRLLEWLSTESCSVNVHPSISKRTPLDREGIVQLARAFDRAFANPEIHARVNSEDARVVMDGVLAATHTGRLDFSAFEGPCYPATGRRIRLPGQRFAFQIRGHRVSAFRVVEGPGLGWDVLDWALDPEQNRSRESQARSSAPAATAETDPTE